MNAYLIRLAPDISMDVLKSRDAVCAVIEQADRNERPRLDLGDRWAGIHFVLSAELPISKDEARELGISWDDDSLENVLLGGEATSYNGTYGPARYLSPTVVAGIFPRLSSVSVDEFKDRYDADALDDERIPPGGWDDERRDELAGSFGQLKDFYGNAMTNGEGLLFYVL